MEDQKETSSPAVGLRAAVEARLTECAALAAAAREIGGENGKECCQSCKKNAATPMHKCPFKEEINDDYSTLCNCCESCEHECQMDI